MLEYGGGTASYFIEVSEGLRKRFPDLEITIVTFDKKWVSKIQLFYSLYFFRDIRGEMDEKKNVFLKKKLKGINYKTARSIHELRMLLQDSDVIYSKNDFIEASILKFLVGYRHLPRVIFGFHTPVFYEKAASIHSYIHNFLYGSFHNKLFVRHFFLNFIIS